jgi:hypothetical protein
MAGSLVSPCVWTFLPTAILLRNPPFPGPHPGMHRCCPAKPPWSATVRPVAESRILHTVLPSRPLLANRSNNALVPFYKGWRQQGDRLQNTGGVPDYEKIKAMSADSGTP